MKNLFLLLLFCSACLTASSQNNNKEAHSSQKATPSLDDFEAKANPVLKEYACDPAPLVYNGKVYLLSTHTGNFFAQDWQICSTEDMINWTKPKIVLSISAFNWLPTPSFSWAAELVERKGKFYIYTTIMTPDRGQTLIAVAESDHIEGPYKDAKGSPLIAMKDDAGYMRANVDPKVFIDNDTPYIFWGENTCYYSKLTDNMVDLIDSPQRVNLSQFVVSPWIHKYKNVYYFSYEQGFPVKTAYAKSESIDGPWQYMGLIHDRIEGCPTNQPAIIEFKNQCYFFFHIGKDMNQRKICVVRINYDKDGNIEPIDKDLEPMKIDNSSNSTPFDRNLIPTKVNFL